MKIYDLQSATNSNRVTQIVHDTNFGVMIKYLACKGHFGEFYIKFKKL